MLISRNSAPLRSESRQAPRRKSESPILWAGIKPQLAVKPNRKQASLVLSAARGRRVARGGPRLRAAYIVDAHSPS